MTKKSKELFNEEQMDVLRGMHAATLDSQHQNIFDAASSIRAAPASVKRKEISKRLGPRPPTDKKSRVEQVVMSITSGDADN